ncbi:uncharacterized protein EV422DRAFT_518045 [Fimicolochytrium jonesii]|uniref:uncharacterized protein n=1 Tax=Fimicolochytrium jonesii TaxID=1396493 RepID=UPI0022FDC949|nr:uncharacterized protein EV422DRAFT_518045 [Fimicolochytrium jonesii]KAI8825243.1 hypothetical protein EV422DRAFT_518045 [Fimicolochytrium jonesii]
MALFNKQQGPRPAVQYQQPQQHLLQQQQAAAAGAGGTRPMQMSTPQQQLQQQHLQQQQQQRLQQQHQQQQAQTLAQQQAQTVAQQQPQSLAQQQQQAQTLAQQQAQTLAQLHQLPAASNGAQQNTANKTTQQQMPRQLPPSSAGMSMTSPAAHTQQHNPNMQAAVGTSAPGAPAAAAVVHNAGAAGGGAPTMNLAQFQQELKVIQSQIAQLVGGLSAADAAQFKELTSMFGERFNLQTKVNALPPGEEQLKSQLEKEVNAKNASIQALRDSAPPNVALAFSKYLRGFGLRRQAELLQHRLSQIAAARQAGQAAGAAHPQAALLQQQALARGLSLAQLQAMQQRQQQQQAAAPAGTAQATLAASLVHAQQQAQLQLQQQQQQAGRGAQTQQTMLQNQQLQQQAASHALLAQQTIAAQTREAMGAAEGGRPAMIQNPGARPQQMTAADMHNLQLRQRAIMEARARAQMQGQAAGAVGGAASGLTAQQIQQMRMRQAAQAAMQQQGNLSAAMGVIPQGVSVQPNTTHAASMAAVSANLMGNPAQVPSALAAQQAAMQARPRGPTASPAGTVRPDFPGNARARPQSVPGAVRPIAQPRPSAVQPMQQSQQQQLAAVKQQQQPANAAAIKLQSQQPHQPALVGPKLEKLPDSGPDPNDGWTPTAKDEGLYNPNNPFTPDFFKNQFTHGIGKIQRFVPRKASPAPGDTAPHGPSTGAAVVADPNVDLDAEPSKPPTAVGSPAVGKMGLGKRKLNELMEQIAPRHRLEPEAEQFFLRLADDFLLDVVGRASKAAKHRGDSSVGVKDLQFELERNWNLRIPGYTAEPRAARRTTVANSHQSRLTLVHKQRLADNARVKAARAAKAAGGAAVVLS